MFAQTRRLSSLELDVPKPLEMFRRDKLHIENVVLDASIHDPRLLPKSQLKRYRRAYDAAVFALERIGMLHYPDVLFSLRDKYRQAKMDFVQASTEDKGARHAVALEALAAYKAASAALDERMPSLELSFWERWRRVSAHAGRLASSRTLREMLRLYAGLKARLDEHAAAVEHRAIRDKIKKEMAEEAELFAEIIIDRWTQMGHCHSYSVTRNGKSVTRTDRVKFQKIYVTEDAIHFKILATTIGLFGRPIQHMPNGVSIPKLLASEMLIDLTHACEREVTTPHGDLEKVGFMNGAYLTVHRLSSADGMLKHVPLAECWAEYPRDMAHLMPIPVGVKRGKTIHFMNLVQKPHILIAGQTGSGKSNLYNVIIGTLVKFHSPQEIQLILCDFKEGVGFSRWEGVQHVGEAIITDLGDLLNMLKRLERLRHERTLMMKGLADDLSEYNRRVPEHKRLPRILVIMDEFQQVAARKEFRNEIISLVEQLTAKARSAGIHIMPGTQTPMAEQVPGLIKSNISVVIAGRMRTLAASVAAFGSKTAMDLANIPGRMSIEDGVNQFQIQVPYCADDNVREALLAAASWPAYPFALPELDASDAPPVFDGGTLLAYAIDHAGGRLSTRAIYPYAAEFGVSRAKLTGMVDEAIASIKANNAEVEHNGQQYALKRAARGWLLESADGGGVSFMGESAAD